MRKLKTHSKSGLFLMEMIVSLLFLALTVSVCIRIFAASWANETKARNLNHIQELTVKAGEILEGTDGSAEQFLALMPDGTVTDNAASGTLASDNSTVDSSVAADAVSDDPASDNSLLYCFDKKWNTCEADSCVYQMKVSLSRPSLYEKKAVLTFSKQSGEILSETEIRFPVLSQEGGAA